MVTSVVLCTYNGASYIAEQLASILEQSMPPDEIVLSDDCSSDQTLACIEPLRAHARAKGIDLVVSKNECNLGYVKNFEGGLLRCRGDVIFLSDQDDVWAPDKIETLLGCFTDPLVPTLVYSDADLVDARLMPLGSSQSEALRLTARELDQIASGDGFFPLLKRNLVTGATVALNRALLPLAVPLPANWVHDEWLAIVAAGVGRLVFCKRPLIKYRQHAANQIGLRRQSRSERLRSLFKQRGQFYGLQTERAMTLKDRFLERHVALDQRRAVALDDRIRHMRFRAGLSSSRISRIVPIAREWQSGRYRDYSNGAKAVLRDLIEAT